MSEKKDLLLLFPPNTEARLFPYLSLPYLSSYLLDKGYKTLQEDLNINLCHYFFSQNIFKKINKKNTSSFKDIYRDEMCNFLDLYCSEIYKVAFEKNDSPLFKRQDAVRLAKKGIELALEGSVLKKVIPSLKGIFDFSYRYKFSTNQDLPFMWVTSKCLKLIEDNKPKIIGISIPFFSQLLPSILICKWIKHHYPDILLVLGGQQVMIRYKELLLCKYLSRYVDALCYDAGEEALEHLIEASKTSRPYNNIPNVIWCAFPPESIAKPILHPINKNNPPIFDSLPLKKYLNDEVQIPLITCVGCYWGRCTFCSYGNRSFINKNYQQLTPEKLAEQCKQLISQYGVTRINFVDENTNLMLILTGVKLLSNQGYKITFSTRNRLEKILLKKEFCQELADLGCVLMSCGYETNSQRLLDKMDKGVKSQNYQKIIDNLHEAGIPLRLSIIGGIMDETEEEFRKSKEFLIRNSNKIGIDIMQMLVMEPQTFLSNKPRNFNLKINSKEYLRGNEKLNYGHGRMGYEYSYLTGESFNQRLSRFIEIFDEVNPEKNADIPPTRKKSTNGYTSSIRLKCVELHPWVVPIEKREKESIENVLADFQYENIFSIPKGDFIKESKKRNSIVYFSKRKNILENLINYKLGRAITSGRII